jgi:hypothetical protein
LLSGDKWLFLLRLRVVSAFKRLILLRLRLCIGKQSGYETLNAMPQVPDGRCGVESAGFCRAKSKEQGARSKEQGARSKEQGARSKEQGAIELLSEEPVDLFKE